MSHWLSRISSVLWPPRMPPTLELLRESSVDQCHGELWRIETQGYQAKLRRPWTRVRSKLFSQHLSPGADIGTLLDAASSRPTWKDTGFSPPVLAKSRCPAQADGNPKLNIKMSFRLESCFIYFRFLWNQIMQVESGLPQDKLTNLGKVSSYFRLFFPTF